MKLTKIGILGLASLAALSANAATLTFTAGPTAINNFADTVLTLGRFDTTQGTLTGVSISYSQNLAGITVQMDNDFTATSNATAAIVNSSSSFVSSLGSQSLLNTNFAPIVEAGALSVEITQVFVLDATTSDPLGFTSQPGNGDYATWSPGTISRGGSGNVSVFFISAYNSSGPGTFTLTARNGFLTSATFSGADGYFQGNTPNATASASVTYTFTPIPEPNTYALGVGILAVAGTALKRRRRVKA